ncbi:hypothetical protein BD809_10447 [Aquimarina intermedia]|uniref:Uncharacterized protein n=2 Tax=Aquimarina intermedia TaxID=350814 RepID=A0A5S5C6Y0_9FLAO|nr:hypothetical protein BD809_10447 [Aquimarina intermedia]
MNTMQYCLKPRFFCLLMFIVTSCMFSQKPILSEDFNFSMGEKYKRIKNMGTYFVASGQRMVAIKKGRKDMTIQRFSLQDLKEDVKKRQIIEDKGDFQSVMELDGKAVVFYTIKDKAYAQQISVTGVAAQKPIQLVTDKENIDRDFGFVSTYGFDAGGRINKFVFKKSFDGSKVLVLFRVETGGEKADKIGVAIYNADLSLLWKRKITLPYPSEHMLNEDFAIDDDGNFYMTASIFISSSSDKDKLKSNFRTEVFKIGEEDKEFTKSKIDLGVNLVQDAVITKDITGLVRVSGFYSNTSSQDEINGVFSGRLSEEGVFGNIIKADFPNEKLVELAAQRETRVNEGTQKGDDKKDFENIKVNDIIFNPDGSFVVLGEQRYVTSQTTSSSSGSRTTYRYYYRDILSFKVSASSQMVWMHKLPKYQIGIRGKGSMSYKNFKTNGKHYLFFVDDFTNLKRSFDEFPQKYYDDKKEFLYLTSYVINDTTGEVFKEPILTGSDIRNSRLESMLLSKAPLLANGDLIIEVFDGKKSNLLVKVERADTKK